jgi:hypothetical protein
VSDPEPMAAKDIANLRAFLFGRDDEIDGELWDGRDGMEAFMAALLDDRDWHRARVEVTDADAERVSATRAKVEAWLLVNGWETLVHDDGWLSFVAPTGAHVDVWMDDWRQPLAKAVRALARLLNLAGLDILDEMAAMEAAP